MFLQTQLDQLPAMPWKDKLAYLVYQFSKLEQIVSPVRHSFAKGKYIREMSIPAGTLFIGRPHTHGHLVELVEGDVVSITDSCKTPISAPHSFRSEPGYQAVFYAVTDVVGRTVHDNPDDLTDVQILEDRDFAPVSALLAHGKMVSEKLEQLS